MPPRSIADFYRETASASPENLSTVSGHFNVFRTESLKSKPGSVGVAMPYDRRSYYKISLIIGQARAEYADKIIEIDKQALLFATPRIPYNYTPLSDQPQGHFCIFSPDFLSNLQPYTTLDELPIFRPGGYPVFQLTATAAKEVAAIFQKMHQEMEGDYVYKFDLLRNYIMELVHFGQKLQPFSATQDLHRAADRVSGIFAELLERQFPVENPQHQIGLRSAGEFADRLAVHVNHLNKVLKETTGKTTTEIIGNRILQEAKILLRQTDWTVSEIAWSLGFEEISHFSHFFKKQTGTSPLRFRN